MHRVRDLSRRGRARSLAMATGLTSLGFVGAALASALTLQVAKDATVMDQTGAVRHVSIVVNTRGHAVYELTGDSRRHPECTSANGCFRFWPPVTVSSAKKPTESPGVSGKLGTWRRDGFTQVTLAGHPLYRFAPDKKRHVAGGEGVRAFGGTWHVVKAAGAAAGGNASTPPAPSPMPPSTAPAPGSTAPAPCAYPPCY